MQVIIRNTTIARVPASNARLSQLLVSFTSLPSVQICRTISMVARVADDQPVRIYYQLEASSHTLRPYSPYTTVMDPYTVVTQLLEQRIVNYVDVATLAVRYIQCLTTISNIDSE